VNSRNAALPQAKDRCMTSHEASALARSSNANAAQSVRLGCVSVSDSGSGACCIVQAEKN
jgi:hypothetical protein